MRLFDAKCGKIETTKHLYHVHRVENMNSLAQRLNNAVASGDAESQIEEIVEILCARKYVQATKSAFGPDPSGQFDESTSVRYYKYIWYLHTHDPESKDNIAVDVERIWAYLRGEQLSAASKYSMTEIKSLCARNYVVMTADKRLKQNWINAYEGSKKWSFNVFALRSPMPTDCLRQINTWL